MIVMGVAVFDSVRKKFKEELDKKTGKHEKANGETGVAVNQNGRSNRSCAIRFWQQMKDGDGKNISARKGDRDFDFPFVFRFEEENNGHANGHR